MNLRVNHAQQGKAKKMKENKPNGQEIHIDPISGTEKKYCSTCGALKPLFMFSDNKKYKTGKQSQCKNCRTSKGGRFRDRRVEKDLYLDRDKRKLNQ